MPGVRPYSLFIFNRQGECLWHFSWGGSQADPKLVFGLVSGISAQLVPVLSPLEYSDGFLGFATEYYMLHAFTSLSGVSFVLTTSLPVGGGQGETLSPLLKELYK